MPSDFGDESGEKLFDWMDYVARRAGVDAMENAAERLAMAFSNARGHVMKDGEDEPIRWARLDMAEFQQIEEYSTIKEIIDHQLERAGIDHEFSLDGSRECLVFRLEDAPKVDDAFASLEKNTRAALERAKETHVAEYGKEQTQQKATPLKDGRPLDERGEAARKASEAHAKSRGGFRERARKLNDREVQVK